MGSRPVNQDNVVQNLFFWLLRCRSRSDHHSKSTRHVSMFQTSLISRVDFRGPQRLGQRRKRASGCLPTAAIIFSGLRASQGLEPLQPSMPTTRVLQRVNSNSCARSMSALDNNPEPCPHARGQRRVTRNHRI